MKRSRLAQQKFIGFTFIWSFLFWGIGIFIAISNKVSIPENVDLLSGLLNNNISKELYKITLVNTLAGYGPLLGALFIIITIPETKKFFRDRFKALTPIKYIVQIVGLFVLITLMPVIPIALSRGINQPLSLSLLGYFIFYLSIYYCRNRGNRLERLLTSINVKEKNTVEG